MTGALGDGLHVHQAIRPAGGELEDVLVSPSAPRACLVLPRSPDLSFAGPPTAPASGAFYKVPHPAFSLRRPWTLLRASSHPPAPSAKWAKECVPPFLLLNARTNLACLAVQRRDRV